MAPDNNTLRPTAFTSKSLSSAKERYRNVEREALGILHDLEKFHHYCFCKRDEYNYRPQVTGGNIQERHGNIIAKTTVNTPKNTPIQR